ncbi:MAG: BamA/TamA family outer membrane protein [Bacteroidales bacterium]|nr:BamA/TamA family outer membrane protein [Candidatus Physcousia equi]
MLDKVSIVSDSSELKTDLFYGYIRQHPNSKWFGLFKVPMLPYAWSSTDSTKRINRFLWRIGEKPVIEDSIQTARCARDISMAVNALGYLDAQVTAEHHYHRKKVDIVYRIDPKRRYEVGVYDKDIRDEGIRTLLASSPDKELVQEGMPFDMNVLDAERSRVNSLIMNNGYYRFNRDFIRFEADTTEEKGKAWLTFVVDPYRNQTITAAPHQTYRVADVRFALENQQSRLRKGLLQRVNHIRPGQPYCEQDVQQTYSALGALDAVLSSRITFQPDPADSTLLHSVVGITTNKPHSISIYPEGTNSAGDLGAALALTYTNRNLFHGSETFSLKFRGAYEAISKLDGYDDQDYLEFGAEASLKFPDFMLPFLSHSFRRRSKATSEVSIAYNTQDRPEFHRRVVSGAWRYRWLGSNPRLRNRLDLIDLNYVYMPWISSTFRHDYLEDPNSRNAILRYNYENLFIIKLGYTFSYSNIANGLTSSYGTNAWSMRFGFETAGNLLHGISRLTNATKDASGHYNLFNIAYAQYTKFDFDFAKSFRINEHNSVAMHFALGIAYPYGNSTILPYEKRYFAGGANHVRGWSVRELGPGRFIGNDGRIDFINQTGDMSLSMSLEYRTHLFWKIDAAAFIDAGNIWTLRNYDEQPGGQFRFKSFLSELAVAYGLGLRLNFNYFVLRFDGGMKAINPAYSDARRHYPILHPSMKRDFAFHFAVGLPF